MAFARRFGLAGLALGTILVVRTPAAHAAGDAAAAEALFGEAKKLVAAGKYAEACPKFAESNRLDRGAGTLIHLADCYEKVKQTASAWATYKEAASAAQALGRADWEKLANKRATALEPTLAKLTIKVTEPADKIEITRDGSTVSQASWGVALPIDSGTHTIEAVAPGRKPFKTTITIAKDGEKDEVAVPKLDLEDKPATPPPGPAVVTGPGTMAPPDADADSGSGQRTLGYIVGGVGVAGVAVGAVTGLMAIGKNNDSKKDCPNDGACASKSAVDAADSAKTLGLVSTIGFIAGGVALGAGAVLILTAKPSRTGRIHVVPAAGPKDAGLSLSGTF